MQTIRKFWNRATLFEKFIRAPGALFFSSISGFTVYRYNFPDSYEWIFLCRSKSVPLFSTSMPRKRPSWSVSCTVAKPVVEVMTTKRPSENESRHSTTPLARWCRTMKRRESSLVYGFYSFCLFPQTNKTLVRCWSNRWGYIQGRLRSSRSHLPPAIDTHAFQSAFLGIGYKSSNDRDCKQKQLWHEYYNKFTIIMVFLWPLAIINVISSDVKLWHTHELVPILSLDNHVNGVG